MQRGQVADLRNVLKAKLIGFATKPEVGVRGGCVRCPGLVPLRGAGLEDTRSWVWKAQELVLEVGEGDEAREKWGDMERPEQQVGCVWRGGWRSSTEPSPPMCTEGQSRLTCTPFPPAPDLGSEAGGGMLSQISIASTIGGTFGVTFPQPALSVFLLKRDRGTWQVCVMGGRKGVPLTAAFPDNQGCS